VLELLGGTTYLGSTGNPGAAGLFNNVGITPTINFGGNAYATAPVLGAAAPWTSSLNMTLTNSSAGLPPVIQAANASGAAESITLSGNLSGSGGLLKTGAGVLTLSGGSTNYTGTTNVSAGTLVIQNGALPNNSNVIVGVGATFVLDSQSTVANDIKSLNLNGNTIVQNGSLSTLTQEAAEGYNNGAWNGSSTALASGPISSSAALGVIQNDDGTGTGNPLYQNFEGYNESNNGNNPDTDVLIKYTYYGDTNLDGKVDGSDYSRIDNGCLNNLTGWFNGDFNYDGVINGSDYTLIDNAFNTQGAQISDEVAGVTAQIAGASGASAVPEPTTLGLLGISALGLLGRRRRRQ